MRSLLFTGTSMYAITEAIFNYIAKNINSFKKHIILVPDRYSMQAESLLLDYVGDATFCCEVMSINRLCSKVLGLTDTLSKQGGIMLLYKLANEHASELKFFTKSVNLIGFSENLFNTIVQIKSSGISVENFASKQNLEPALKAKIEDLLLLYGYYEDELTKCGYTDGCRKIDLFRNIIKANEYFEDAAIYFVGYETMTKQNLQIVNEFVLNGNFVCVGALSSFGSLNDHVYNNELYEQFKNLFNFNSFEEIKIKPHLNENINHVFNNLFAYKPQQKELNVPNVQLYACNTPLEQIENLASYIRSQAICGNARYKDFNVLTSNLEGDKQLIKKIFAKYNIPYYLDLQQNLSSFSAPRLICDIFEGVHYGFLKDDWYKVCCNYFFGLNQNAIINFNNLFTQYNLNGYSWLSSSFNEGNELIAYILNTLMPIIEDIKLAKNALEFVNIVKKIEKNFNFNEKIASLMQMCANNGDAMEAKMQGQVLLKIDKILEQIVTICGEQPLSAFEFVNLFTSGVNASTLATVPVCIDSVFVGDESVSYIEKRNYLCLVGANYGRMPAVMSDCGLISDDDIDALSYSYLIEPKVAQINNRAKNRLLQNISLSNNLYVSYLLIDESGKQVNPSIIVENLRKMFTIIRNDEKLPLPILKYDSYFYDDISQNKAVKFAHYIGCEQNAFEYTLLGMFPNSKEYASVYDALKNKDIESEICNMLSIKNSKFNHSCIKNSHKLFFVNGHTSISQLERFYLCPYRFFLERGLKLNEIKPKEIGIIDVGNFIHKVCQLYCDEVKNNLDLFQKINKNEKKLENMRKKLKIYAINGAISEFKELIEQTNLQKIDALKKESMRVLSFLEQCYINSNYIPYSTEQKFKNFEFICNGKPLEVVGYIDRVDVYGNNFFVCDYKTGSVKLSGSTIYSGKKMQLLFYANAFKKISGKNIGGFAYLVIKDKFTKNSTLNYEYMGIYNGDKNNLLSLDLSCDAEENCSSEFFDFEPTGVKKNLLSTEQISHIANYVTLLCQKAVDYICAGFIASSPSDKNDCTYCPYKLICNQTYFAKPRAAVSALYEDICEIMTNKQKEEC